MKSKQKPRHIKIRGKFNPTTNTVTLTILQRTHSQREFGRIDGDHNWYYGPIGFIHKNIRIYNDCDYVPKFIPLTNETLARVKKCFLIGKLDTPVEVTLEDWRDIKEAVEAYNKWGEEAVNNQ